MIFNKEKILELYKRPKNASLIDKARSLEYRIRVHSESIESPDDFNPAHLNHMNFVRSQLPKEKSQRYESLFMPPLPTNSFIDSVYKEHKKVFEGNNSYKSVNFTNEDDKEDFNDYIKKHHGYIERECWEAYKNAINSIMLIDIVSDGDLANPFPRIISIFDTIDIENNKDGSCKYFMYQAGDDIIFVDDEKYVVFKVEDDVITEYNETPHIFGYTPARQIWSENLLVDSNIVKTNIVGKSLFDLDMLLFCKISKEYADLYAKYPIMWMLPEETNNTDEVYDEAGNSTYNENVKAWQYGQIDITEFSEGKKNVGAGSAFIVAQKEDGSIVGEPIGFVSPPIENMKFIHDDIDKRKSELFMSLVGHQGEFANEGSKNEKHLEKVLESRKSVIYDLKYNFEIIYKFYLSTMAYARHPDSYDNCFVSMGDEFYLKSVADLDDEFKLAKESGQPVSEQVKIYEQILETKYRNNPDAKQKALLLLNVEPYPTLSNNDIISLMSKEGVNPLEASKLKLKFNFSEYIKRYEREFMPITSAIIQMGFDDAIIEINKQINTYNNE